MNDRERFKAIMHYQPYDRLPLVHFAHWNETLERWAAEGHLSAEEVRGFGQFETDAAIARKLGFDFDYFTCMFPDIYLRPFFTEEILEELPGGGRKVRNIEGVTVLVHPGATGIPTEVEHLLKGRKEWEEHYKPRLQFDPERVNGAMIWVGDRYVRFDQGGLEYLKRDDRTHHLGLYCGSLFGNLRTIVGLVGVSLMLATDEDLYDEMIEVNAEMTYRCVKMVLESGARFDFAHFWEDIACKSGPLVIPSVFDDKVGPHYRRITDLCHQHGIDIISLDCDGCIDALAPIWLKHGVNTMFPIEVGTWKASIAPWRAQYGRELRGVGGMDKKVFAYDYAAIDAEVERLRPLVELGGFIPCPDHRIAPDAKWENVQYYCERMLATFTNR